jgi:hypothetical protein
VTAPDRLFFASSTAAALLVAGLFAAQTPLRAGLAMDAMHHLAAVRELAKGEFPPRHNLVAQDGLPQGHYGPYLVLLGLVARWSGAPPLAVLEAAGVLSLLAFVFAFRMLASRLLGAGAARWAALAPLLLWGPWPGLEVRWPSWAWPGSTSLADAHNFFYPQQAGTVLALLVLVLIAPPLKEEWSWRALGIVLLVAVLIATHPLSGLALLPALAAVAAAALLAREATPARIAFVALLPVAGLAVAALWPYYPVLGLLKAATLPGLREPAVAQAAVATVSATQPHLALAVLDLLGPALAGVVAALSLARRGRPLLLLWLGADLAIAGCSFVPLHERFVFAAALPAQLAACWLLDAAWSKGGLRRLLALALLACGALSAGERIRWLLAQEVPDLAFVEHLTPPDAVVLSDPTTSNGVAGLAGRKVVAPLHPDLFLVAAGGWQRVVDAERFFAEDAGPEEQENILRRWHVTHVLVDRLASPGVRLSSPLLHGSAGYALYDVGRSGSQR